MMTLFQIVNKAANLVNYSPFPEGPKDSLGGLPLASGGLPEHHLPVSIQSYKNKK